MESKKMKSESVVPGVVGFLLMLGPDTTPEAYNPDIFSFRRIVLAPGIAFAGFVFMVYAIMRNSK